MFVLTQVYRPDHLFLQERLDPGAPERLSEGRDVTHRWTRQNALPCPGCGRGDSVSGCAIKQKPLKTLFHQFRVALSVPAWLSAIWLTTLFAAPVCAQEISNEQRNYFEKHVRPLLAEQCLNCHSADSDEPGGNLRLDSQPGWSEGGDSGPAIVPGRPDLSLLIQAVRHTHQEVHMPPDEKLAEREIRILEEWVRIGAPDPRKSTARNRNNEIDLEEGRKHWSFQSPHGREIPVPDGRDSPWPTNEIDCFILAEQKQRDLKPAPPANKRTLIRRAAFDLTGLPPTPAEIEAFLQDDSSDAYAELIDRLLESPRYGERWGRFWLDVARYADSNGLDENIAHGNAWRYRDYVIDAFNCDKPYDQFVLEQLAGDMLPPASESIRRERIIATGFLSLGPKVLAEVDQQKMEMDIIDEQVEAVGRAFMGLTLGCARCHDHKFDPISTEDYYAIAGIFKSTRTMEHFKVIARWHEVTIASETDLTGHAAQQHIIDDTQARIDELTKATDKETGGNAEPDGTRQQELKQLEAELSQLKSEHSPLPSAMAVTDYEKSTDLRVHIRGSVLNQGETVPRGFPAVLVSTTARPTAFSTSVSGRLELARWLTNGSHPLVARVMVNRLWRWHFGRGLVETTDNFGHLGTRPINQPLLDWLADRFVADGWSIRKMHRLIMLSSTYRMSSRHDPANASIDPENQFQWRARIRRLEAEALRDAVLAVSGRLNLTMGGSLLHVGNREFLFDHTSKDETKYDSTCRSVYLPVIRNHLFDAFQLFDYNDASVINSNRSTTTVAPQALFMMNSNLITDSAVAFAAKVFGHSGGEEERIRFAYELALGRPPHENETSRAKRYLNRFAWHLEMRHGSSAPVTPAETAALPGTSPPRSWVLLCQTLLMSNEFICIR